MQELNINGTPIRNHQNVSTVAVSSTTSETKAITLTIEAGSITGDDLIRIEAMFVKVGTANSYTVKMYYNTADSLSGAVLIGTDVVSSTALFYTITRRLYVRNSSGAGSGLDEGTSILKPNSNIEHDYFAGFQETVSPNWRNKIYIICSIQPASSFDTITHYYTKIYTY